MTRKTSYLKPQSLCIELQQEQLICASDLQTRDVAGLEDFYVEDELNWGGVL